MVAHISKIKLILQIIINTIIKTQIESHRKFGNSKYVYLLYPPIFVRPTVGERIYLQILTA